MTQLPTNQNDRRVFTAPLRRFIQRNRDNDVQYPSSQTSSSVLDRRDQCSKTASIRSEHCSECSDGCSTGTGTRSVSTFAAPKPKRSQRRRTSKTNRSHSTESKTNKTPGVDHCSCGKPINDIYGSLCEDCYVDEVCRWSGRDQSAIIHW